MLVRNELGGVQGPKSNAQICSGKGEEKRAEEVRVVGGASARRLEAI